MDIHKPMGSDSLFVERKQLNTMRPSAWTSDVPNGRGGYTTQLSHSRPTPIGRVNIEPLYTKEDIDKSNARLVSAAKEFLSEYERNEEDEWSPGWRDIAERFRLAIDGMA